MSRIVVSSWAELSHLMRTGRLLEMLIELALPLRRSDGKGYDFETSKGTRLEARSRSVGTDGKAPRITLTKIKMENSSGLIAAHFDKSARLVQALLVPIREVAPIYDWYKQADGNQAHLPWRKLLACPGAKDITADLRPYEPII